jgi:hypothetical protein
MPPRLNKRQQRELEELEALGKGSPEVNISSEDEGTNIAAPSTGGGFAAVSSVRKLVNPLETLNTIGGGSSSLRLRITKKSPRVQMKGPLNMSRLER